MKMRFLDVLSMILTVVLFVGCNSTKKMSEHRAFVMTPGEGLEGDIECENDLDCPEGFVCMAGLCPGCESIDGNCPPCLNVCLPDIPSNCEDDEVCPEGFVCVMECIDSSTMTCPEGECDLDNTDPLCAGYCLPEIVEPPPDCSDGECPDGPPTQLACDDANPCPEGFECALECMGQACVVPDGSDEKCPDENSDPV